MFEIFTPPRKNHLVTAKMLQIYEESAKAELELLKGYGNSKPSNLHNNDSLELRIKINMQEAWLRQIKRIRKNYFSHLYAIALMYNDVQLKIFSLAFLRGATDKYIATELSIDEETVKNAVKSMIKDIDSIALTADIDDV